MSVDMVVRPDYGSKTAAFTTVPRSWYDLYWQYRERLSASDSYAAKLGRERTEQATDKAMGYVWGWQDSGVAERDSGAASDFAYAYGAVVAEYELGLRFSYMPIQDAWRSWLKFRRIVDHYGELSV